MPPVPAKPGPEGLQHILLTIYITARSFVEQASLLVDILLLSSQKTYHFEINKSNIPISNNASFSFGSATSGSTYCLSTHSYPWNFVPGSRNGITHYFSLLDFTETAWHSKKLASFPRKSLQNSMFSSVVRNFPGMQCTVISKPPSITSVQEGRKKTITNIALVLVL